MLPVRRLALIVVALLSPPLSAGGMGMDILGYVERVQLLDAPGMTLKARLDTGAKTSSLHAVDKEVFEREGEEWIAFVVRLDEAEDGMDFERPVERWVRIVQHDGEHQRRPVVRLRVCAGSEAVEHEVSLVDRSAFTYPMLLGRNFLAGRVLVDASASLSVAPDCSSEEAAPDASAEDDSQAAEAGSDAD